MKRHYSIVKTEWLNENLNCEVIATFNSSDDAKQYFNSYHKEFFNHMEENYTACNFEWKEDFKVYCYCLEGCAELAMLCASDDESVKQKIVGVIKHLGEEGATETEKYVEIYSDVTYNGMELAQMIWLGDTATLQAYFLDEHNEGWFADWSDLPEDTQNEIGKLSIWD